MEDERFLLMVTSMTHNNIKNCKIKIKDGRGQIQLFIYDKKDGVFHNKNKNKILAPNYMKIPLMVGKGEISEEKGEGLWKSYFEKYGYINNSKGYVLEKELDIRRAETHTGNHYRNHFVSVPPNVYGN